jgi:hypothetical protein
VPVVALAGAFAVSAAGVSAAAICSSPFGQNEYIASATNNTHAVTRATINQRLPPPLSSSSSSRLIRNRSSISR